MSYTVEYNPELRKVYPIKCKRTPRLKIKPLVIALGVFAILYTLRAIGILYYIVPGDSSVTVGAFSCMVEQVRSGQSVSDAIFTFIKEVIVGGM